MNRRLTTDVSGLGFAEAPRWHDGRLWFVDYFSTAVLRTDFSGPPETFASVEGMPGGLGFLPDGDAIVVSQRSFTLQRIGRDGRLTQYADLSAYARGAANELLVDPQGRAYVGHHGFDFFGGAEPKPSTLLLVESNGRVRVVAEELVFPNGMALTPDGRTLIVAESFAERLTAFDVASDGSLSNQRLWASIPGHTPDGICLDAEGAVWAGSPLTGAFLRVREGGQVLERIDTIDKRWAVACVFGGARRDTLHCITAATTLEGMPKGESEAFVESVQLSVGGAGLP